MFAEKGTFFKRSLKHGLGANFDVCRLRISRFNKEKGIFG